MRPGTQDGDVLAFLVLRKNILQGVQVKVGDYADQYADAAAAVEGEGTDKE